MSNQEDWNAAFNPNGKEQTKLRLQREAAAEKAQQEQAEAKRAEKVAKAKETQQKVDDAESWEAIDNLFNNTKGNKS